MKANVITKSLACRRKEYKRPVSHLKKIYIYVSHTEVTWRLIHHQIFNLQKKRLQKEEKRKKKKNTHSMTLSILILKKKKKNTLFSWLTHQLVLAINLVCSRIFISGSFFVFSSFASFIFFMVCCWSAGPARFLFFFFA